MEKKKRECAESITVNVETSIGKTVQVAVEPSTTILSIKGLAVPHGPVDLEVLEFEGKLLGNEETVASVGLVNNATLQHGAGFGNFWMGGRSLVVPMSLHAENRQRLAARLQPCAQEGSVVLLASGKSRNRDDTDHEELFRQESYFHWSFGVKEPDCYGTIAVGSSRSTLFVPRLPAEYAVWMGKIHSLQHFKDTYQVDEVRYVDELATALQGTGPLLLLKGLNTDSGNEAEPASFEGDENFQRDTTTLFPAIVECRVVKTEAELEVLRYCCKVTSDAHMHIMRNCKPGLREYQLESLFQYHVYTYGGCRNCAYTCICASGFNGATLHYGHAGAPNDKLIREGDTMLMDMGCEYHCYCADITASFPSEGTWTADQRAAYTAVYEAVGAVERAMRPGVIWADMHMLAAKVLLEHLVGMGILAGDIQDMLDADVWELFFPCGLGHFIGCDVHDVGGYPKGMADRIERPGISKLRTTRVLKEGMVLTVEPGLYFADIQIDRGISDPALSKFIKAERLLQFRNFGGFRIEDQVVVGKDGVEHLEQVPRDISSIEAICNGATTGRGLRCDGSPVDFDIDITGFCQPCL